MGNTLTRVMTGDHFFSRTLYSSNAGPIFEAYTNEGGGLNYAGGYEMLRSSDGISFSGENLDKTGHAIPATDVTSVPRRRDLPLPSTSMMASGTKAPSLADGRQSPMFRPFMNPSGLKASKTKLGVTKLHGGQYRRVKVACVLLYPLAFCAAIATAAGCRGPSDRPSQMLRSSDPFSVAWSWGSTPGLGRPTGKPLEGFALSVIPDRLALRLSDPQGLQFDIDLKNVSGHAQEMYLGSRRSVYKFRILNLVNGKSQLRELEQGPFPPGARFSLPRAGSLIVTYVVFREGLAAWFPKDGKYSIKAMFTGPPLANSENAALTSNSATITVLKDPLERRGVFGTSLKSNKSVYSLGEQIALGLTITNNTDKAYAIENAPPSGLCNLLILDSASHTVRPIAERYPGSRFPLPAPYEIAPKGSITATTYYPFRTISVVGNPIATRRLPPEWESLFSFGYSLTRPDNYRIRCTPRMRVIENTQWGHELFLTSNADRSNEITVHIARWSLFGFPFL